MVIGEPYKFAIIIEEIKEWNSDDTFGNGILQLCVEGSIFPKEIVTATLHCEIPWLKDKLEHIMENKLLFDMPKEQAFKEMYSTTFPNDFNCRNNYSYYITPISLEDEGIFVFAVKKGNIVRILADKLNYILEESSHDFRELNIVETHLSYEEITRMITLIQA